jgi:hypothetical protein
MFSFSVFLWLASMDTDFLGHRTQATWVKFACMSWFRSFCCDARWEFLLTGRSTDIAF